MLVTLLKIKIVLHQAVWTYITGSRGVLLERINKKTSDLFEMDYCVNFLSKKSSFPSQYTFICADLLLQKST